MLCTAVSSVIESNIISFVIGVVVTSVVFLRHMYKNRKKNSVTE